MKKVLVLFLALLSVFTLGACGGKEEKEESVNKYMLPDLTGLEVVDAIVKVEGNVNLNPVYVRTNEVLPGVVLGYGGYEVGDEVEYGSNLDLLVSEKPNNSYTHDKKVLYISEVCPLTGPKSPSFENLKASGIYGTDLGIPVKTNDGMILLFGDSYSGAHMSGHWLSNFITKVKDDNYNDNLMMETVVNDRGMAKPFFQGRHEANSEFDKNKEVTKIPTGGIQIGEYTYVYYMSIRFWGVPGSWLVNYNGVVRSKDLVNWEEVPELTLYEDDAYNFGQVYPYKDKNSDYIYLYGIPGGRNGGVSIGRTKEANYLNLNEYEWKVSKDKWVKGMEGLKMLKTKPYNIVDPMVSELSVAYNPYLAKYTMTFLRNGRITMLQCDTPDGEFKDPIYLSQQGDYVGIYGGFIHEEFMTDNGKCFYMTISSWQDYNTYWVKVVLK